MADIALGSAERIFKLAVKIKEAVRTVQQNEEECRDIERCVARASALLRRLHETTGTAAADEVMRGTLEDLAGSLERALELVAACQRKPKLRRLLGAGDMSKKLRRVQDDIMRKLTMGSFASILQVTILLTTVHPAGPHPQDNAMVMKEEEELAWKLSERALEFTFYNRLQILEATNNFSEENKIGCGGFGSVYKGQFPDGLEIAVKRLAPGSLQGSFEFENEIQVIRKLQHINLVRLLGCCKEEEEKILVYEYLPNGSLDTFIFDETRRAILDWNKRLAIIEGIAQGLLYMHKHSRVRVIHRDIKASNILLDNEMNPKITDFGVAKIFIKEEPSCSNTVVGTPGYIDPEYAVKGQLSVKSDVYSLGVLILEIISGRRASSFYALGKDFNLSRHAWHLWKDGLWLQLVNASLVNASEFHAQEMMRCINIALLCVQRNAADRPTMSDVVAFLSSSMILLLPEPKDPAEGDQEQESEDSDYKEPEYEDKPGTVPESDSFDLLSACLVYQN